MVRGSFIVSRRWILSASLPPTAGISPILSQAPRVYLKQCQTNGTSPSSTVFRGTLYEIHTMTVFQSLLNCANLVNVGGAYDNGLDLIGSWDLIPFWDRVKNDLPSSKSLRGLLISRLAQYQKVIENDPVSGISLASDVDILVQCKNSLRKIGATVIRELSGIYNYHVKKKDDFYRTFMFLASPLPMTAQAVALMEGFKFPAGHLQLDPLSHALQTDPYDIKNYSGGRPQRIYFNTQARKLLKGLNVELQLKASLQAQSK